MDIQQIKQDITSLPTIWIPRNQKFKEWYSILNLEDKLKKEGMESTVTNDPRTFFNLANYLMTAGKVRHIIPIGIESGIEMDRQSRCERACSYMWYELDSSRRRNGRLNFIEELVFDLLMFGWYSVIGVADEKGVLTTEIWSPPTVYPRFEDREMTACLHRYQMTTGAAINKAKRLGWDYKPVNPMAQAYVTVDNYFFKDGGDTFQNIVLVDGNPVTDVEDRDNVTLLVGSVGGFPDMGEIDNVIGNNTWTERIGQSILATDAPVYDSTNRWMTFMMQLLRDTAEAKYKEISNVQKITPDQIYKRGALFHLNPGEDFQAVAVPPIPMEVTQVLQTLQKQSQKGSFSDVLFGIVQQGMSGYAFSQLTASANMILGPYQEAKHFVIRELDRMWLKNLKTSKRVYVIKGKAAVEKLRPTDIPDDVVVLVESELATPKDMMERGVVASYAKDFLDQTTILEDIWQVADTQLVKRRKIEDQVMEHPMAKNLHLAISMKWMAEYMEKSGYRDVAKMMAAASQALQAQLQLPPPGGPSQPVGQPGAPSTVQPSQAQAGQVPRQMAGPSPRVTMPGGG